MNNSVIHKNWEERKNARLVRGFHFQVNVPCCPWTPIHDAAPREPGEKDEVLLKILRLYLPQVRLCISIWSRRCKWKTVVPIECVLRVQVRFDRFQVDVYVVKLLQQEEARRHALTSGDRIALLRRCADKLKELLRKFQMLTAIWVFYNTLN